MDTRAGNSKPNNETGGVDSLASYFLARSERERAYERYNYALSSLDNAKIIERLAEIKSQHEPLASLLIESLSERDRLYAAAFYVVVGRMP